MPQTGRSGEFQPSFDFDEHLVAGRLKRVGLFGFDGSQFNLATVDANGALLVSGTFTANLGSALAVTAFIANSVTLFAVVNVAAAGTVTTNDVQTIADNAPFTDGTSRVFMSGHVFDQVAGTVTLSENDAAASKVDLKRAQVVVLEDSTDRSIRATFDQISQGLNVQIVGSVSQNVIVTQSVTLDAIVAGTTTNFIAGSVTLFGMVNVEELPAAQALADSMAKPTTTMIGAVQLNIDGSTADDVDLVRHRWLQARLNVNTSSGAGTSLDISQCPMSNFAVQITRTSGTVSAYNINIEGLVANTFIVIQSITSATGADSITWIAGKPVNQIRSNVVSITGAAGTVRIDILAVPR